MDKNVFSAGGSSDPFVELALSSSKGKKRTAVKTSTVEPVWHEQFVWAVAPASSGPAPVLTLACFDSDALSRNDPMGDASVALDALVAARGAPSRQWYPLSTGGAVEVVVQWRHAPANDWRPFGTSEKHAGKAPNELRVGLSAGRDLAIKDKNLLSAGGSSDPYVKFALAGTNVKFASTVAKKTLDPVWREIFVMPLPADCPPLPTLRVDCWDHDTMGSDAMGGFDQCPGNPEKPRGFRTLEASISVEFQSIRLLLGSVIISARVLEI
jgi:Ca2+-dependent lipid-binding protein